MENITIGDINKIIRIAKKYYEVGLSQEQISIEEEISKSTVSRILDKAEKLGYIKHTVIYPVKTMALQEELLKRSFRIEHIFISPVLVDNKAICLMDTCKMVAEDLNRYVSDNDIISVSWGRTMEQLAELLVSPISSKKGVKIVQLNGSIATSILSTKTAGILQKFTENYSGIGYMVAAPALVDTKEIANAIKSDSRIKMVLDLVAEANIAVFSIGQISENSVLIERGSITLKDVDALRTVGAVGDICTRFFDIKGNLVNNEYNARTIGVELADLKNKKIRIAIAVGSEKADAIIGALRGGYVTSLYMDEITAASVLKRCEELGL
jgi:deoxyribonucleoside regulator